MTKKDQAIIEAYQKGYRVTPEGVLLNPKNEVMEPKMVEKGYPVFNKRIGKDTIRIKIHRFAAYCKYRGRMFKEGVVVRHLNADRTDFSWANLKLGTQSQNSMDRPKEQRIQSAVNASRKLVKYDKKEVRAFHEENGGSYKKTMEQFNISSKGTLHNLLTSKIYI